MTNSCALIEQAIEELRHGKMIILTDDPGRENEGDLVMAADFVTAEAINFMTHFGRGLICLPMQDKLIDKLQLPPMVAHNRSPYNTAFTVSIEAAEGVTTGISAFDRAHTIKTAIDPNNGPASLISPGHIFPLRAHPKGVLGRRGQTEGSVDLMRLAGLTQAAVICEVMNADGSMSRADDLAAFAAEHKLLIISNNDVVNYRLQHETLVEKLASARLPTLADDDFNVMAFKSLIDDTEYLVLHKPNTAQIPLVRIHSECLTGDVFGSLKCDCGEQLKLALAKIAVEGGIFIYLRQEGRGIGLANKLKAYALQEQGYDTVEANIQLGLPVDSREYSIAYQILRHFGLTTVRLLTNNPHKVAALQHYGIKIAERLPLTVAPHSENLQYLKTKQEKLGHALNMVGVV